MASYGADVRNAVAAAIAALLSGTHLFLLSESGRTLAVIALPAIRSPSPGVLEIGPFPRENVIATGELVRYEIRRASGPVLLSGYKGELQVQPPELTEGGLVYVDSLVLIV